jgi:hypothetical protein
LLFEQGSAAGLAICLERLLSDESLRVRMGENAKSAILRNGMTKDRMFSRYEKLYSQILSLATI